MKIARVFPSKTNMNPNDKDCYFGLPELYTPIYDEVHISVVFTWDLPKVDMLKREWQRYGFVKVGGPALNDIGNGFIPGMYLRKGVTITSRGCPKKCPFCFVPKREGAIRELKICPGNVIQDNNLLACSEQHIKTVFEMLRTQRGIDFSGGLDAELLKDWMVEELRNLSIKQIWLAYDKPADEKYVCSAVTKLKRYFPRDKIRCYVLIAYDGDTIEKAETRLRKAWEFGTLPFAMRYRTATNQWQGTFLYPQREWNLLTRRWTRPAIMKKTMTELQVKDD